MCLPQCPWTLVDTDFRGGGAARGGAFLALCALVSGWTALLRLPRSRGRRLPIKKDAYASRLARGCPPVEAGFSSVFFLTRPCLVRPSVLGSTTRPRRPRALRLASAVWFGMWSLARHFSALAADRRLARARCFSVAGRKFYVTASSTPSGRLIPRKTFTPLSAALTPHAIQPSGLG